MIPGYKQFEADLVNDPKLETVRLHGHCSLGFGVVNGDFQRLYNTLSVASEKGVGGGAILGDTLLLPVYDQNVAIEEDEHGNKVISPDVAASDRKIDVGIVQIAVPVMLYLAGYKKKEVKQCLKAYWPDYVEGSGDPQLRPVERSKFVATMEAGGMTKKKANSMFSELIMLIVWARSTFTTSWYSADLGTFRSLHGLASGAPGHSFVTTLYYSTVLSIMELHSEEQFGHMLLSKNKIQHTFKMMGIPFKEKVRATKLLDQAFCGFKFVEVAETRVDGELRRKMLKVYGKAYKHLELVCPMMEPDRLLRMLLYPSTINPEMGRELYRVVRALQALMLGGYQDPIAGHVLGQIAKSLSESTFIEMESLYEEAGIDIMMLTKETMLCIKEFMRKPTYHSYLACHHPKLRHL